MDSKNKNNLEEKFRPQAFIQIYGSVDEHDDELKTAANFGISKDLAAQS